MTGAKIGLILTRVIVPAWVLVGALFKLYEASPRLLPGKTILSAANSFGIDLYVLLAVLIGLEFFAVAIMLFAARLARPMAIFMLSVFCLVLLGEMAQGNLTACGCLGGFSPPPWAMLLVDGSLLAAVALFNPSPVMNPNPPKWPIGMAVILSIGAMGYTFYTVMDARPEPQVKAPDPGGNGNVLVAPNANPNLKPAPSWWFTPAVADWKGQSWRDVELFQFMPLWPESLDEGTKYVVFYSRTCDHCEDMFIVDLSDPALARDVTAVLVPGKEARVPANSWDMPLTDCEMLELPFGPDWIITTPLAFRIVDGRIEDVVEGEHQAVMGLE